MKRTKKLCIYLDEYVRSRDLRDYRDDIQKVLLQGIRNNEVSKFAEYVNQREKTNEPIVDIVDEVGDLIKDDFFSGSDKFQIGIGTPIECLIRLGIKGRKLLRGNWFKRQMYFWEYAYGEHVNVYTTILQIVIGIGLGVLITNFLNLGYYFIDFIKLLLHLR